MNFDNNKIKLITNNQEQTYEVIKQNLLHCKSFLFNVAFITWGGFQILVQTFNQIKNQNIKGKILTTSYQTFTDPKVMKWFLDSNDFEMKVVDKDLIIDQKVNDSFHPKGYIFEFENYYRILIGSVNMTEKAMKTNVEWSLLVEFEKDDDNLKNILDEFDYLWNNTKIMNEEFINDYNRRFFNQKKMTFELSNLKFKNNNNEIIPNLIQEEALKRLDKLRQDDQNKALVIAATGVGKTYLSAFDVKQYSPKKMLFVVHREEILLGAQKTYSSILKNKSTSIFKSTQKETEADMIFASQQTLFRHLDLFKEDEFDYIVIDEAHHACAGSYLKIINYFKPKFLLGMTATPERTDGENIYELFGNNIAIEMRLKEAIEQNLITSFHYFGITDLDSIDLSNLDIEKDLDLIAKKLMINKRVDYIIEQMNLYQYDGPKLNCVAFCVNKEHAIFMCEEFNKRGIKSEFLISDTPSLKRKSVIEDFLDDDNSLSVLFVVDILNEGVDIPKINLILFLRPTSSPIIFLQQLGRGLRKNSNKQFLTVLDFIANHKKTYLIPFALASFNNVVNERYIQDMIKDGFKSIPEFHIQFDNISQDRILQSFANVNIYSEKWIKNEYLKFKKILNRVPKYMCDYLINGAPDLLKIIRKYKNYLTFLSKIENDNNYSNLLKNDKFEFYLTYLNTMLPIYRINEFILILEACKNKNNQIISFDKAKEIIDVYTPKTTEESIRHTFKFFNHDFYSNNERNKYPYKIFNVIDNYLKLDNNFKEIIDDPKYKEILIDCLEYGIRYFLNNYNLPEYVFPFIKFGARYYRTNILFINQSIHSYNGILSNIGGVFNFQDNPNHFYLTINFQEDNKYDNRVLTRDSILWYSPNNWKQDSKQAIQIINQKTSKVCIHILIRKYKTINNITQPFIYLGKATVIDFQGNSPIQFKLKLENPLPDELYYELINKK